MISIVVVRAGPEQQLSQEKRPSETESDLESELDEEEARSTDPATGTTCNYSKHFRYLCFCVSCLSQTCLFFWGAFSKFDQKRSNMKHE